MSEGLILLLLLVLWVALALGCHIYIKRYFLASFMAACLMVISVQVVSYIELGYLDPFWLIAMTTSFFMAAILSLIVGLPFKLKRTIKHEGT